MADLTLTSTPALGGYREEFDGVRLSEQPETAIVSIAVPRGGRAALAEAFRTGLGVDLPAPGTSVLSKDGAKRVFRMAPDQFFVVFDHDKPDAARAVDAALGGTTYVTDQTDVWVTFRIDGPAAISALERICPIDLNAHAFPEGRVARTVMEHLGTIILRDGADTFTIFSARSSARSFLHAVQTSIRNVV